MKLKEKHKQFVVKSFACFMKLTDIVDAFIEEFEDELPPLIRDEFCANYRVPDLISPGNLTQELETLYGYKKQRIFQAEDANEATKTRNFSTPNPKNPRRLQHHQRRARHSRHHTPRPKSTGGEKITITAPGPVGSVS